MDSASIIRGKPEVKIVDLVKPVVSRPIKFEAELQKSISHRSAVNRVIHYFGSEIGFCRDSTWRFCAELDEQQIVNIAHGKVFKAAPSFVGLEHEVGYVHGSIAAHGKAAGLEKYFVLKAEDRGAKYIIEEGSG
jgi:hypothetical protein